MSDDRTFSLRAYPLAWPEGWKRTASYARTRGTFGKSVQRSSGTTSYNRKEPLSVAQALARVLGELERMGINENNVVISTNLRLRLDGLPRSDQANPADPGAAVYWRKGYNAQMKCMAIDRYDRVEGNLAAIAATLEAMRSIERHGGAEILERTFQGFTTLPAQGSSTWRAVLGFSANETPSIELVEARFREYAKQHHPDTGGTAEKFHELTTARDAARQELGR